MLTLPVRIFVMTPQAGPMNDRRRVMPFRRGNCRDRLDRRSSVFITGRLRLLHRTGLYAASFCAIRRESRCRFAPRYPSPDGPLTSAKTLVITQTPLIVFKIVKQQSIAFFSAPARERATSKFNPRRQTRAVRPSL